MRFKLLILFVVWMALGHLKLYAFDDCTIDDGKPLRCPVVVLTSGSVMSVSDCSRSLATVGFSCRLNGKTFKFKTSEIVEKNGVRYARSTTQVRVPKVVIAKREDISALVKNESCYLGRSSIPKDKISLVGSERVLVNSNPMTGAKIGEPLRCVDRTGNIFLVGVVKNYGSGGFYIDLLKDIPETMKDKKSDLSLREQLQAKCVELSQCKTILNKGAHKLVDHWALIVSTYNGPDGFASNLSYKELDDILLLVEGELSRCNKEKQYYAFKGDSRSQAAPVSEGLFGDIKGMIFNFYPEDKKEQTIIDTIVKGAKGSSAVTENLSEIEIQALALQVIKGFDPNDAYDNRIAITRKANIIYAKAALSKILLSSKVDNKDVAPKVDAITREYSQCLNNSTAVNQMELCTDKFKRSVPIKVGEALLLDTFDKKMAYLFSSPSDQSKTRVKVVEAYYNCVAEYYQTDSTKTENDTKACVFKGILKGTELVAKHALKESIAGEVKGEKEVSKIFNDTLSSLNCTFAKDIRGTKKYNLNEYKTLAKYSPEQFEEEIQGCSDKITATAGDLIVRYTISNTAAVKSAVPVQSERDLMAKDISGKAFATCLEVQKKNRMELDPKICRNYVVSETTLTLIEKSTGQKVMALYGKNNSNTGSALAKIKESIKTCRKDVDNSLREGIKNKGSLNETLLINCFATTIGKVAETIALDSIFVEMSKDPTLSKSGIDLKKMKFSINVPELSRNCFEKKMRELKKVDDLGDHSDRVASICAFEIKRAILPDVLKTVGLKKMGENLDKSDAELILASYFNPPSMLLDSIAKANTEEELSKIIGEFTENLTWATVSKVVNKNLDEYFPVGTDGLKSPLRTEIEELYLSKKYESVIKDAVRNEKLDNEVLRLKSSLTRKMAAGYLKVELDKQLSSKKSQVKLHDELILGFDKCTSNRDTDSCLKELNYNSYLKIGVERMSEELKDYVSADELAKFKVSKTKELKTCYDSYDGKAWKEHYMGCMIKEVFNLTNLIGDKASKKFSRLVGGNEISEPLRKEFEQCISNGKSNFASAAQNALKGERESITLGTYGIDNAMVVVKECSDKFEGGILASAKARLMNSMKEKGNPDIEAELSMAIDLAFKLRGKSTDEDPPSSSPDEIEGQLLMLTGKVVEACEYSKEKCREAIKRTKEQIEKYQKSNPVVYSTKIMDEFYRSDLTFLIVRSTLAASLKKELKSGTKAHRDSYGILDKALDRISGTSNMERIFNTTEGEEILNLISARVAKEGADAVASDDMIKTQVVVHLLMDDGPGGFVDSMIEGFVEPKLREMKEHPSLKIVVGNMLGMVNLRDFEWSRIKETPKGIEAARYFKESLLLPNMTGTQLSREEFDKRTKHFEALITDALTALAKGK